MYFFEVRQIEEISREYFEIIEDYFEGIYQPGIDKIFQAEKIGYFKVAAQTILASLDDLEKDLTDFWKKKRDKVIELTSNSDILKVMYCGGPSPMQGINFIKRTALYMDSLLIEDPLSFLLNTKSVATDEAYLNQLIKHSFNLLDMKHLFFGEGEIPLLIIFPSVIKEEEKLNVTDIIEKSGDEYFRLMFERDFLDTNDVFDYLSYLDGTDKLLAEVKNTDILFPNVVDKKQRLIEMYSDIHMSWKNKDFYVGSALGYKIYGQFHNLGTQVFQAQELSSQIVFDKQEYWNLYKWDISQSKGAEPNLESALLNTLQLDDFRWLELMDIDRLNEVRNKEDLANIRGMLRKNINVAVNGVSEEIVKRKAIENIEQALLEHSEHVEEYSNKIKKKLPIDTLAIIAGTITSIPTSWALLPIAGAASTVYGIYDFYTNTRKAFKDKKRIQNNMMGVLFDAKRQVL
ncbi:hypothetical protein [Terribacillus saccharophilus]|uniref:Uncharacterized protein n=1 Tax=Terribacillus saccharophilus TaxID=361277 RepID=A0A268AB36_9BACI|nr:hypothetical protein [Terribacillus saccharophilus]PAD21312.1 hypothetical protein CHH64_09420 [Terribacillus saccharophilus]